MISTHEYRAVVKRPGRSDAVLSVRGGNIDLDSGSAPHVTASCELAVPAHWAPLEPYRGGHWEPTGAPQYPFFPGPPFTISEPAQRWVADPPGWYNPPVDDVVPEPPEEIVDVDFFGPDGGPPFHITETTRPPVIGPPVKADIRDIDPRDNVRIVITATRVDSFGIQQVREFDLNLRDRAVSQSAGTIRVRLASDEALLIDWTPLVDDLTPIYLAASLRDVVDYVLTSALDTTLAEATGDFDMTPRWSAANLLSNPDARLNVDFWSVGSSMSAPVWASGTGVGSNPGYAQAPHLSSSGHIRVCGDPLEINATPGRRYVFTGHYRSPDAMDVRLALQFRNDAGRVLATVRAAEWMPAMTSWNYLVFVSPPAPPGTSKVTPIVTWQNSANGRSLHLDRMLLDEGEFDPGYFDGSDTTTATYSYEWTDASNASPSTRTLLVDGVDPDALAWRADVNALDFLAPLVQACGLRLVCDEQRQWTLRPSIWEEAGSIEIGYADNLLDGDDVVSRDDDSWFDAAVTRYTWTSQGVTHERTDVFALQTPYTRVRVFEKNAPYPGAGFSEYAVRRAQGRGRQVTATAVADWDLKTEMGARIILNGAVPQLGRISRISYDLTRDEMTITTRTADEE